ncbi:lysylphosphatidylglycerol synthase transmembrane domain-containing protein [Halodesulfurarchaeum sp. HSR-GB]|uniref:lysylphosphatidylglycerol synthase transmembrane domain-containing protein n=1 Tax=Halodesulfurarchaeum sp. HSR-GB TaxID=3074077 RepID=UPI00285AA139|nr:lysylphosphatidylglycerol synthase transmembrane domain-containing protein [Halodesulfurarchaeum sp. HSR-GB]MDR5656194.1 lysylphosphatidylglycerol synthase transmembrane domain-containing protein [Halodesulfurarchaeum sp. HSR-GB]
MRRRQVAFIGFLGSLAVMGVLLSFVGIERIGQALSAANPQLVGLVAAFGLAQVAAWGLSLRTVLGSLGVSVSRPKGIALYASAMFANNVTPFGQAGGEPVTAYVINRVTDTRYESALAAIATVDAAHIFTSISIAVFGAVLTVTVFSPNRKLTQVVLAVFGIAALLTALAGIGLRYRRSILERIESPIQRGLHRLGEALPAAASRFLQAARKRYVAFRADLGRVASNRVTLVTALGFSSAGWLFEVGALAVALWGLGGPVPLATLLIVIPVGKLAGFMPLPGGFGSIEATLVALLVATTPVDSGLATAAVLLHRAATYWLPTLLGGGVSLTLGARARLD